KHKRGFTFIICNMNFIFGVVFILSAVIMTLSSPEGVISAMTSGATKAVTLSLTLTAVYALWSGVQGMTEKTGINGKIEKLLSPVINFLFKNADGETKRYLAVNLSANLLGLGGIATPAGIKSASLMGQKGDGDGMATLFVLAATSIQLLPTTVIALRESYGSVSPSDIFLPTLLSTAISTATGIILLQIKK
ncbi:MAG: hypothetical protein IJS67_02030, partial [Clostridia bacterium]|nr:hypothetical protein [Clostridia bacterium]